MDSSRSLDINNTNAAADDDQQNMKQDGEEGKAEKTRNSFYECPTAACSIASVNGQQDSDNQFVADISKAYSFEDFEEEQLDVSESTPDDRLCRLKQNNNQSSEGGSVSYSSLQRARGGYFAGSLGTLFQRSAAISERPRSFLSRSVRDRAALEQHTPDLRAIMTPPCTTPNLNVSDLEVEPKMQFKDMETPPVGTVESPVRMARQLPFSPNDASPVTRASASMSPALKDYSRAVECGNTSETSFVHEGYDIIQVPRYRPVEVVDKVVEVPVVHHVDTYVPKKEIQEIESIVKKPYIKYVDKIVEVPEVHYTDKIVEVPEYHEVTKTITKVDVQERVKYVPKVEVKVVPKYVEVPVIKIVDKYEEYEEVEEVIKEVEKVEIVEVPREVVKHVVKPVKKIIEQERIVPVMEHRDVPVEKIRFVPKVETVELVREIPKVIDVPVPYNVPKIEYVDQPYIVPEYRDVQVAVPVRKRVTPIYHYKGEPEIIDVPVHKPYFVIHDHITFKPAAQPFAENIKVVGARPIDLSTLNGEERIDAQNRMQDAIKHHEDCSETSGYRVPVSKSPKMETSGVTTRSFAPASTTRGVELPVSEMTPSMEPRFGAPKTPSEKIDRSKGPIETIIYRSPARTPVSPFSEGGVRDVYPRSNNTTPRAAF
ncbi:membrane skeletal protein [Babesia ovis]|uniref:Membrane skeletal protein n=1 Tax=Babesia ovis TaxID=5869 RepID=A0A9W5T9F3_BABOV|nr:membrane skeletal protein [Babesia ovis]